MVVFEVFPMTQAHHKPAPSSATDDLARAREFLDKLLREKVLSKTQYELFVTALQGFGGGWTEDNLDRAWRAITRLNASDKPVVKAQVFVHNARGVLADAHKKTEIAFRFLRVLMREEAAAHLEAIVLIFFAARDQPQLLDSI